MPCVSASMANAVDGDHGGDGKVGEAALGIGALDATVRLFQPDAPIGLGLVPPAPRRHQAIRGESCRLILRDVGRAHEPMATRHILEGHGGARAQCRRKGNA